MQTYSNDSELRSLRYCCLSVQLNTIFTSFDRTLRTLGTAVEREIPAEPEITLSSLIDWLVWEVPNATVSMTVRELSQPLFETLNYLMNKDNISVGRPRTKALSKLTLFLPKSSESIMEKHHIKALRENGKGRVRISRIEGDFDTTKEWVTLTSDQPRRDLPVVISLYGSLNQSPEPKIRKLTFRASKL